MSMRATAETGATAGAQMAVTLPSETDIFTAMYSNSFGTTSLTRSFLMPPSRRFALV